MKRSKCELLAPAGDLEKLKMAVLYGADAVYMSAKQFGLRAAAGNFENDDIKEGVEIAHNAGCKVYQTMNIFAHNNHIKDIPKGIEAARDNKVDALIISDAGVIRMVRRLAPEMEIHLSTQASCTNLESMKFWIDNGVKRVVLARELSLDEIKGIRESLDRDDEKIADGKACAAYSDAEIEVFVHGAMCVSYSGRCLLSNYMTHRNANQGMCAHPCRWKYNVVEEKRPGEYMPVEEDENGTYIFNSRDLCMIKHIPDIIHAGADSLKIEGRNKSAYYVASITSAYRQALDHWYECEESSDTFEEAKEKYAKKADVFFEEVCKASHREFSTGFFFGKPDEEGQVYGSAVYQRDFTFCGIVTEYDEETGIATVEQRNRFFKGDDIEVMCPHMPGFAYKVDNMKNDKGEDIDVAPHAQMKLFMNFGRPVEVGSILRKNSDG